MADALTILTQLSVLLLIGILGSVLAKRLGISNVLILLITGFALGRAFPALFVFEEVFLVSVAVVTLALVVFEGTSRLSLRTLDQYSAPALNLTVWQLGFVSAIVGVAAFFLFFSSFPAGGMLALILAISLAGTDPSSVLIMVKHAPARMVQLLTLEAVVNTPVMIVLPFMLIDGLTEQVGLSQLIDVVQQTVVGVGTGVLLGVIIFKTLRKYYSSSISPVLVVTTALLAYILAENLGGSGVLAVATLGILFGNFTIKRKEELQDFSFAFSSVLEILIFLLIGIIIGEGFPLEGEFLLKSLLLFLALVVARALAVTVVLYRDYSLRELAFMTLTMPKGIAVAVLIFSFALFPQIPRETLSVLFAISLYSVALSTIVGLWWQHPAAAPEKKTNAKTAVHRHKHPS